MAWTRFPENPLITPAQVQPSLEGFEVIGTFNAGAVQIGAETLLLVRVAERPLADDTKYILYPMLTAENHISVQAIRRDDPRYDTRDPRIIREVETGRVMLTSISHIRLARSIDGIHFHVDSKPFLAPQSPYEAYGVEDARITPLDGHYYINYSAVSPLGIGTGLVSTTNFEQIERHGLIFPPANRDVVIFPEQINGKYIAYHRPMPAYFGDFNMWIAESPDLHHWGNHRVFLQAEPHGWESGRVGAGAPPIRTEAGWFSIYHAADRADRYCLGAILTALDDPGHILGRSANPILEPIAEYERVGVFPNVVFACGIVRRQNHLIMYYGAADQSIAAASISLNGLLDTFDESSE